MTMPTRPLVVRALLALALLVSQLAGCAALKPGPKGDPVRMSDSELDIATDLWWRRRQPREALKHALRAVELDDKNADASHLVSLIYLDFCQNSRIDECRLDEAERFARAAVAAEKKFLPAQNTLAVILIHQGRHEEAIALLGPLTENMLYPTPEIAWGNLGWAYLEKGQPQQAVSPLRRAVAAQPLFCVGHYRLGLAYQQTNNAKAALQAFDRALETNAPGCANLQEAYLHRARVHLTLGQLDMTRADLDRCIGLQKTNEAGKECGALLSRLE